MMPLTDLPWWRDFTHVAHTTTAAPPQAAPPDDAARRQSVRAPCASQLGFQFGGRTELERAPEAAGTAEAFRVQGNPPLACAA